MYEEPLQARKALVTVHPFDHQPQNCSGAREPVMERKTFQLATTNSIEYSDRCTFFFAFLHLIYQPDPLSFRIVNVYRLIAVCRNGLKSTIRANETSSVSAYALRCPLARNHARQLHCPPLFSATCFKFWTFDYRFLCTWSLRLCGWWAPSIFSRLALSPTSTALFLMSLLPFPPLMRLHREQSGES